jgi:hypothetical protein
MKSLKLDLEQIIIVQTLEEISAIRLNIHRLLLTIAKYRSLHFQLPVANRPTSFIF